MGASTAAPSTSSPARDAVAGAFAGAAARVVVGPLDVVKIRLQVQLEAPPGGGGGGSGGGVRGASTSGPASPPPPPGPSPATVRPLPKYTGMTHALRTIVQEEGLVGLWRGTIPGLLMTVPYTAVQFVALQAARGAAAAAGWEDTPRRAQAAAFATGAAAGTAATVASYPFDLLRTTLAAQGEPRVYTGMLDAARGLVARAGGGVRGARALYTGLGVTLVEIIPYAALQFGLYDALTRAAAGRAATPAAAAAAAAGAGKQPARRAHRRVALRGGRSADPPPTRAPPPADPATRFVCGLLAGTAAKLATHPLDVVKKRYQVAGLERAARYGARVPAAVRGAPLRAVLTSLATAEGLRGCYKGALPSLLKAAPQAAVTLTAFEWAAGWLAGVGL